MAINKDLDSGERKRGGGVSSSADSGGQDNATVDREVVENQAKAEVASRDRGFESERERPDRDRSDNSDRDRETTVAATATPVVETPAAEATPEEDLYAGTTASMGADATEYLQKSQAAAEKLAEKQAKTSSLGAARSALAAAKTSGLSAGEAALSSGAQAGQSYTDTYDTSVNQGMDRYQGATSQFGNIAGQRTGENLSSRALDIQEEQGAATAAAQAKADKTSKTMGWLSAGASALGAVLPFLLSDENAKKNIQPTGSGNVQSVLAKLRAPKAGTTTIEQVLAKVRPVTFDYKGEKDGSNRVGVIAQELEQSPLKETVKTTEDGTKVIDATQLTGGNTAMILELAQMVIDMRKELQMLKGNK